MSDDPKAVEYSQVLANQTLMQAKLEKLEADLDSYRTHLAQLYEFVLQFGKALENLQLTIEFLLRRKK